MKVYILISLFCVFQAASSQTNVIPYTSPSSDPVQTIVEVMPEYPGGISELSAFI